MRRSILLRSALAAAMCASVMGVGALLAPASTASSTATSPSGDALAVTPPMGFNNWARFGCSTNNPNTGDVGPGETLILDQAKALVSSGLRDKGFTTVTIDDCWMTSSRDANGNLVVDTTKFPDGMAYIGTQLHDEGLKFGIYEDIGTSTCGGRAGSYGHFQKDADQFASWGVDYVKLDGCNMPSANNNEAGYDAQYSAFAAAMKNNAGKRDMVFSESSPAYFSIGPTDLGHWYSVVDSASQSGQLWRSGYDVKMDHAGGSAWADNGNGAGVLTQYGYNSQLARYSGPGSWNDPDFLITGDGLTDAEGRSQLALYSVMGAPLILSVDVPNLSTGSLATLGNSDVIAVDQDPLGAGGYRIGGGAANSGTGTDLAVKPLSDGSLAVVVLNKNSTTLGSYALNLSSLGLDTGSTGCGYTVKDLWHNQGWTGNATSASGSVSLSNIGAHDNAMLKITPGAECGAFVPTGQITASPTGINHTPLCLEKYEPASGATSAVDIAGCTGNANQRWQVESDGTVRLVEPGTNSTSLCLTAPDGTTTGTVNGQQGQWLSVDTCGASADSGRQNWAYNRDGNLILAGATANAGQCLDVYQGTTGTAGTPADLGVCGAAPDSVKAGQAWSAPVGATTHQADTAGTLGGGAQVASCGGCPDGNLVGFIGGTTTSGTLTFNRITVPDAGTYQLQIDYINGGAARTDDISVDGATATAVSFPGNGSWTTVQSKVVAVGLKAGANTIEFGNPAGWAASIAAVSVPAVPSGTTYTADAAGTLGGGAAVAACGTCLDGSLVGDIGGTTNSGTLTFKNVVVSTAGTYQLRVSYINGDPVRTEDISVDGATAAAVTFPGNGSWTVLQNKTITVTLKAGTNTIQFGNPTGWAASISTITV